MYQVGWSQKRIVPPRPAMLQGQMHTRVAKSTMDPLTVTAMAIQGPDKGAPTVIISFDLAGVSELLRDAIRARVAQMDPQINTETLIMAATHTHTSLVYESQYYPYPGGDVMTAPECAEWLTQRGAEAIIESVRALKPANIGRAFGHAVVAHNRRAVYADGHAQMYGSTSKEDFRYIEGYEDHSLDMLFVWNPTGKLAGVLISIPCPSQVDEGLSVYSADYWHEIRVELRKRHGEHLQVLPLCGPAGDQSPHFLLYAKQEQEMRQRRGVTERQEIALRVADALDRSLACTQPMPGDGVLKHRVERIALTPRGVSKTERDWSEAEYQRAIARMDPTSWWPVMLKRVVDTYEGRHTPSRFNVELHFLRIGEAALATNPFELYVDYGLQIKARSTAPQTILAQITSGSGWYLPTQRAVDGGSYGATPVVCKVGPEGGQELVQATITAINALFPV